MIIRLANAVNPKMPPNFVVDNLLETLFKFHQNLKIPSKSPNSCKL